MFVDDGRCVPVRIHHCSPPTVGFRTIALGKLDGEILVYGSYTLVHTLIEHHLADELRLCVFPVVLGSGRRLFDGFTEAHPMRLTDLRPVGEGIMFYTYEFEKN